MTPPTKQQNIALDPDRIHKPRRISSPTTVPLADEVMDCPPHHWIGQRDPDSGNQLAIMTCKKCGHKRDFSDPPQA